MDFHNLLNYYVSYFNRYPSIFLLFFSVFWDLYCAAPERRETCDHSSEAKAFHDYVSTERSLK